MANDFSQRDRDDAEEDQFFADQRAAGIVVQRTADVGIDEQKERVEFEATEQGSDLTISHGFDFAGQYADPSVQNRWIGWLRAKRAVAAQSATV